MCHPEAEVLDRRQQEHAHGLAPWARIRKLSKDERRCGVDQEEIEPGDQRRDDVTLKVEHTRCAQHAERGDSGLADAPLRCVDELTRDEPVSAEEADQNNDGQENHEARGGRRTNQLARRVRFFRLPERLLKPRDGSRRRRRRAFRRRARPHPASSAAGRRGARPESACTPPSACDRTIPALPPSMRSSSIRRAPAARSAGSRPTTRARSVTIGRLKNTRVGRLAGPLDVDG